MIPGRTRLRGRTTLGPIFSESTEESPTADGSGDETNDRHVATLHDHAQAGQQADPGEQTIAAFGYGDSSHAITLSADTRQTTTKASKGPRNG